MPRKKEIIVAVSVNNPDTMHTENASIFNFVCKEKNLKSSFISADKHKIFKENEEEVNKFLKQNRTLFDKPYFINNEMLFIDEISLSNKLKSYGEYLYQILDYSGLKPIFVGFNDLLKEIDKKIKNKKVRICYDGIIDKGIYNGNDFANIVARMTTMTKEISINQIKGNGDDDYLINIIPFKIIEKGLEN